MTQPCLFNQKNNSSNAVIGGSAGIALQRLLAKAQSRAAEGVHTRKRGVRSTEFPAKKNNSVDAVIGGSAGIALQRLLAKPNRVQPKGFTRKSVVCEAQNSPQKNNSSNAVIGGSAGNCLTAIVGKAQSRAAEGVHTQKRDVRSTKFPAKK